MIFRRIISHTKFILSVLLINSLPAFSAGNLVVIDMQPHTKSVRDWKKKNPCDYDRLISRIKARISLGIEEKSRIFFLEYRGFGETDALLKETVGTYDQFYVIQKRSDDGSEEILAKLDELNKDAPWGDEFIEICGVNTNECVYTTTKSLADVYKKESGKIRVIVSATYDTAGERDHQFGLVRLSTLSKKFKSLTLQE